MDRIFAGFVAIVVAVGCSDGVEVAAASHSPFGGEVRDIGGLLPHGFEPSGAAWQPRTHRLIVVSDDGRIAEIDAEGGALRVWPLAGDLEDVCIADAASDRVYVAVESPPSIALQCAHIAECLPAFEAANPMPLMDPGARPRLWLGNAFLTPAHIDELDNLACVVAGRRRFTLFPPAQIANLYIGPLDFTPAGQAISLVDFARPDYQRFPRFAEALAHARVAELGAGDAIFIPSMWWHHIESLDSLNVLVNYWWRQSPAYMDSPIGALMMTLMTVRDLPAAQRAAWENLFRHYVFEADEATVAHIPEAARRSLGALTDESAREIRARLLARLNR